MGLAITSIIAGVLLLAVIIREVRKPKNNVYIKSDEDLIREHGVESNIGAYCRLEKCGCSVSYN